ncbi:uncharacterized protein LOC117570174 [Drosophila albomicans]|uniref:Uncharacterized protein LOC117570174 n=1 Tax=Drosophila albomicans TaxID=7291 RepID=A0A6P8WV16_DROAB|nr:uncharacterized protein LOC117570174 [Drosophila albomicans]
MSKQRSPSWASVVAHGIHKDAKEIKENAPKMSVKSMTIKQALEGSPTLVSTTSTTKMNATFSDVVKQSVAKDAESRAKEQLSMAGKLTQSGSFRTIWPQPPPHHKTNAQGLSYRPRRHVYGFTHLNNPRIPTSESKNISVDLSPKESVSARPSTYEAQLSPKKPTWWRVAAESPERRCVCSRTRCQITSSPRAFDLMQWQPIAKSQQMWLPLDSSQRHCDPSNPMPRPPPGFEHVVPGRQALSSRAREVLGEENIELGPKCDYAIPKSMPKPERELREQQHFIAKHDTHLTCRQAQLKVINGATEDGYYVHPVAKLLPTFSKQALHPKYKPKISYAELLRRNREKEKLELRSKDKNVTNSEESDNLKPMTETSPKSKEDPTDPKSYNNLPNCEIADPQESIERSEDAN